MKPGEKTKPIVIGGAIVGISVLLGVLILPSIQKPVQGDPSESELSASITFSNPNSLSDQFPRADALPTSSFFTTPQLSVVNSAGTDITGANMIIQVKARVTTGDATMASYSFTGELEVLVDNARYETLHSLKAGANGSPPDPLVIKIDNVYNELVIPVSEIEKKFTTQTFGDHIIQIKASGLLTANFISDCDQLAGECTVQKSFQPAVIGQATLTKKADTTLAIELISNLGSSGSTTVGSNVTDTWTTQRTNVQGIDSHTVRVGQLVTDSNRRNIDLLMVRVQLYENTTTAIQGDLQAVLKHGDTDVVIARSLNVLSRDLEATYKYYSFAFPAGSRTPANANHYIAIECISCDTADILIAHNKNDPWKAGHLQRQVQTGLITPVVTNDLVGSATYKLS